MAGELIVDAIKAGATTVSEPGTIAVDGNVTVTDSISAQSFIGSVKPHHCVKKWSVSESMIPHSEKWYGYDEIDVSLGLEDTQAIFVMANIYAVQIAGSTIDHVNHFFGYDLPDRSIMSWSITGQPYFELTEEESFTYVVMTFNGDGAGSDIYGTHQFMVIPLKENRKIDVRLAHAFNAGAGQICGVKLRVIGYME